MSDSDFEFEDEAQDQSTRNPVRERMRELEAKVKQQEAMIAENANAARKLAFVEAGVDLASPATKYFIKGYEGDLTTEAIRAAAEEANLVSSQNDKNAGEKQAFDRMAKSAKAGEGSEPAVDWVQRMNSAKNSDEIMALIAQAKAEAENY